MTISISERLRRREAGLYDECADTIDALVAALERISRDAKDRSEKAWFRLDMIADEADAALALARA